MYYDIVSLCPRNDISMSVNNFVIKLYPQFRELVAESGINQEQANTVIGRMGRHWLDSCGFDRMFDPDNCGHLKDTSKPPGPKAYHSYQPNRDLRVKWGEWGLEHITVPGNACGLDIDPHGCIIPKDGMQLVPHKIDTINQKLLLLVVFTWFAESMTIIKESEACQNS